MKIKIKLSNFNSINQNKKNKKLSHFNQIKFFFKIKFQNSKKIFTKNKKNFEKIFQNFCGGVYRGEYIKTHFTSFFSHFMYFHTLKR